VLFGGTLNFSGYRCFFVFIFKQEQILALSHKSIQLKGVVPMSAASAVDVLVIQLINQGISF